MKWLNPRLLTPLILCAAFLAAAWPLFADQPEFSTTYNQQRSVYNVAGSSSVDTSNYNLESNNAGESVAQSSSPSTSYVLYPGAMQIFSFPDTVVTLSTAGPIVSSATLTWQTPGYDSGLGSLQTGTSYYIRVASYTTPDTFVFGDAQIIFSTSGTNPGVVVSTNVTGLLPHTIYYATLWTIDAAGNISFISNESTFSTTGKLWTNGTGDLNWYSAGNWTPPGVPTATDITIIDRSDIVTVSASSPPITFAGLQLGGTTSPTLKISTGIASGTGWLEVHNGATLQQDSTLTLTIASATIFSGGLLTHTVNPAGNTKTYILNLVTTGDFNLQAGATISVSGLGYAGGVPVGGNGYGTGGGTYASSAGGGGGHGGAGGSGYWAGSAGVGGPSYDLLSTPNDLGSGGGSGSNGTGPGYAAGGAGGGVVILSAGGTLSINGAVYAAGAADLGTGFGTTAGGGAGGTVNLTAGTLAGSGSIQCTGGQGGTYSGTEGGGGGGGGRIALSQTTCSSSLSINAPGGTPGFDAVAGSSGTWYPYPPSLVGTAQGVSSITWTWGSLCNANSYQVVTASNNAVLATGITSPWNDVNLATNTLYGVQVQGVNTTGFLSSLSPSTSFYTLAAEPGTPAQPFTNVAYTSVTVSWLAQGNPGYTQYFVQASTMSNFTGTLFYPPGGATWMTSVSTTVVGLADGTLYYFEVQAKNGNGILTAFDVLGSTQTLLESPPNLVAPANGADVSTTTPIMTWSTLWPTVTLQLAQDQAFTQVIADSITANNFYISTNTLSNGTTYWWRAQNVGYSDWSSTFSFFVDVVPPIFSVPQVSTAAGTWTNLPMTTYLSSNIVNAQISAQDINSGLMASTGLPTGLVGQWHLDEGSGTIALDASANTLNGTLVPSTMTWVAGMRGNALNFNGTNQYVNLGNPVPLQITGNITIEAWVKFNSFVGGSIIYGKGGASYAVFFYGNPSGALGFEYSSNGTSIAATLLSNRIMSTGVWYHVVGTYDQTQMCVYIDGIKDNCLAQTAAIYNAPVNAEIGAYGGSSEDMNGAIDEVRVYNVARSSAQIVADYESDQLAAHNRGAAYNVFYSTTAGANWNFVSTASVTMAGASNGDTVTRTLSASNIPLVTSTGPAAPTNQIAFTISDVAGNVSTTSYVVLIDTTPPPTLTVPANTAFVSTLTPIMTWSATTASSRLQLAQDSGFTQIIADSITANSFYISTNTLSNATPYWWRVAAVALNPANWSPTFKFTVDVVPPVFSVPQVSTAAGTWSNLPMTTYLSSNIVNAQITVQDINSGLMASTGLPTGLVGQWHLDEGSGTIALDASTNTLNGTLSGGPAWVAGKRGNALSFNGSSSVSLPSNTLLDIPAGGSFTLSAWIKTTTDGRMIFDAQNATPLYYLQVGNTTAGGTATKLVAYLRNNTGGALIPLNGNTTVTDGNWHNVVLVNANTSASLYVDGHLDAGPTTWAGPPITISGGGVESIAVGSTYGFNGNIDEVRFFNIARSSTQIAADYESDQLAADNSGAAYNVFYSTTAGANWNFVSTANVTMPGASNGDTVTRTLQVSSIAFASSANPITNQIAFTVSDVAGNVSTTSYSVLVDTFPEYPGCAVTRYVKQSGGYDATTIGGGLALLPNPLTGPACVVIEDAATYQEQVNVQGFTNNGSSITILTDPAVGSYATVSPLANSTAAFVIANSSVNIFGINIVPTNAMTYGVDISSTYVQISSVNVQDAGGKITMAGVVTSSWTTVSYSSVTVDGANATGFWLVGSTMTSVSYSSAQINNGPKCALYLIGASSNTFTGFFANNPSGNAACINTNSNYNRIIQSTITSSAGGWRALILSGSSSNTITRSYIADPIGYGLSLESGSDYNTISLSTMVGGFAGSSADALYIWYSSGNTITQSYINNSSGYGADLDTNATYNTISLSTITSAGVSYPALWLNSASSNTITQSYIASSVSTATVMNASNYNTISQSTMTSGASAGINAIGLYTNASSSNQIIQSNMSGASYGAYLDANSNYNTLSGDIVPLGEIYLYSNSYNLITQSIVTGLISLYYASYSTITLSDISNGISDADSNYNTISLSTITATTGSSYALYVVSSATTTISGSVINATGGSVYYALGVFASGAVTVSNSILTVSAANANASAVYINSSNNGLILLSSNTLSGGAYGLNATTSQSAGAQLEVLSNTIIPSVTSSYNTYGLSLNSLGIGATIENNTIAYRASGSMGTYTSYGLYANTESNLVIDHNRINEPGMITAGSYVAAYFTATTNSSFKFNDVNSTGTGFTNAYLLEALNTSTGLTAKDNVFLSSFVVSGASATVLVDAGSESGFAADYNDYYSSNALQFSWGGTLTNSLSGWQTLTSSDTHSISQNPLWSNVVAGVEDFHPMSQGSGVGTGRCSAPLANYGTPCTSWAQDGATSPTIDAADPAETTASSIGLGKEPAPNGCLPNQGSTGQTSQASTSVAELSVQISTNFYNFGSVNMVLGSTISISSVIVTNVGNSTETYELSGATITPGSIWTLTASTQPSVEHPVLEALFQSTQPASSDFSVVTSSVDNTPQLCGASGGNYADGQNGANVSSLTPNNVRGLWFKLFAPSATIYGGPPAGPTPQEIQVTITATLGSGGVCTN